jgi:hypothetical protein
MCLRVSYKKKNMKKIIFPLKKGVGSGSISQRYGSEDPIRTPKCPGSPTHWIPPYLLLGLRRRITHKTDGGGRCASLLSAHALLMQRHPARRCAPLQIPVASVPAQLAAHPVVAVQRADRVAHPPVQAARLGSGGGQVRGVMLLLLLVVGVEVMIEVGVVGVRVSACRHEVAGQASALGDGING